MYSKEYTDVYRKYRNGTTPQCPKCSRILLVSPLSLITFPNCPAFRVPGLKHVEYYMLMCKNWHFFIQVGLKGNNSLYEICCDDDFDWYGFGDDTTAYYHKYNLSGRVEERMYKSMIHYKGW